MNASGSGHFPICGSITNPTHTLYLLRDCQPAVDSWVSTFVVPSAGRVALDAHAWAVVNEGLPGFRGAKRTGYL